MAGTLPWVALEPPTRPCDGDTISVPQCHVLVSCYKKSCSQLTAGDYMFLPSRAGASSNPGAGLRGSPPPQMTLFPYLIHNLPEFME
jgi:hypothetical protein